MAIGAKAMQTSGVPAKVTMDKSGANKAAIDEIKGSRRLYSSVAVDDRIELI